MSTPGVLHVKYKHPKWTSTREYIVYFDRLEAVDFEDNEGYFAANCYMSGGHELKIMGVRNKDKLASSFMEKRGGSVDVS